MRNRGVLLTLILIASPVSASEYSLPDRIKVLPVAPPRAVRRSVSSTAGGRSSTIRFWAVTTAISDS